MIRYIARTAGVHFRHGKSLYLLTVGGITLGVASVLSIQIINRSALAAFSGTVDAVSGTADLSIVGRVPSFPESLLVDVLATPGVAAAWPLVRGEVITTDAGQRLDLVGVDFLVPVSGPADRAEPAAGDALGTPGWIAVSRELAQRHGWEAGDTVPVTYGSRRGTVTIGGWWSAEALGGLASRRLALMDIAQAQSLLGLRGRVQQIDVRIAEGTNLAQLGDTLAARLGPGVNVTDPNTLKQDAAGILRAFRLNLSALSLISLLVGLFLVYASTQAALVRRRTEFGVLRSLGASQKQVLGAVLAEVSGLGLLGVLLGVPAGYWIAERNVSAVSATVTNLYLLESIERVTVPPALLVLAAAIGVGGALLGAIVPALDVARRDPRALLSPVTHDDAGRRRAGGLALGGLALLAGTGVWYFTVGTAWRPAGFVLAFAIVSVLPLVAPAFIDGTLRRLPVRGFGFSLGVRSLTGRLRTATVSTAALSIAVAMLVAITLMVESFRRTLDSWIGMTVAADVYVTTESWRAGQAGAGMAPEVIERLRRFPGVEAIDRLRGFRGYVGPRRIGVAGIDFGLPNGANRFSLLAGTYHGVFDSSGVATALISEPLARGLDVGVGDTVAVAGVHGPVPFAVAGVYHDYGNESGSLVTGIERLEPAFGPGPVTNVALYVNEAAAIDTVIADLERALADLPLVFRSNRRLRTEALRVFDQTFAITRLLQGMGLLVAATGITLTLLVIARERVADLALFRALGATRPQIFRVFVSKGVSIGAIGVMLGSVAGVLLAAVLIYVINRTYFGWTIEPHLPFALLGAQIVTILAAAAAASTYPALRAARVPASELRRDDA